MIRNEVIDRGDYYEVICNHGNTFIDKEIAHNLPERTISVRNPKLKNTYAYFKLNGKHYKLHRYIMEVVNPKIEIDHINGNPLDNRCRNLRKCTTQLNCRNRSNKKNSKVKYKGVSITTNGKFKSRIQISKEKRLTLGTFDTAEEAAKAYNEAAIKYHKEFKRLNEIDGE